MNDELGTILVVDDNEMNRDLLCRRLQRKGYAVATAVDGHQALEFIEQKPFALVLLDIMMPGISGLEVLKTIREQHSLSELPVIMVTAKEQNEEVVKALKLGANDYVPKPIDLPVLLARIDAQMARKQFERERAKLLDELRQVAIHDELTGLYNRRHFDQTLNKELQRAQRYAHPLTLLILDPDGFKQVNDQLGHLKGDEVLREIGQLMQDNLRESDLAFRYGGDEFVALLVETNGEAKHVVERMSQSFAQWLENFDLQGLPLGLSIGQVTWRPGMEADPESLLREADLQLYEQKRGKDVAKMQRQLSEKSQQVRFQTTFLNSVNELIVATDLEGKVIYANQAFGRWCNRISADLMGQPLGAEVSQFSSLMTQVKKRNYAQEKIQRTLERNEINTLLITPSQLKNARGTPYGYVFLGSDITLLEQTTQRLIETQRFLERLNAETQLESILQLILEEAVNLIPNADSGSARLLNEESGYLEFVAAIGWDLEQLKRVKIRPDEDFHGVKYHNQPVIVSAEDLAGFDRKNLAANERKKFQGLGYPQSSLSIAIQIDNCVIGKFNINNKTLPQAFSQKDVDLLCLLLPQIELAIKRAQERQALQQAEKAIRLRNKQLAAILKISEDFKLDLDLDHLLERIAKAIQTALEFNRVAINLLSDDGQELIIRTVQGVPEEERERLLNTVIPIAAFPFLQDRFKISHSYFVSHEAHLLNEQIKEFFYVAESEGWQPGRWHAEDSLFVPLETHDKRMIGLLSVDDPIDGKVPSLEVIQGLEILANQAAIAIENAALYETAKRELSERQDAQESEKKSQQTETPP